MEDTHMCAPNKISTLLVIMTLAFIWSYRCASQIVGCTAIAKKAHGRRAKSFFRIGLDALRKWILFKPQNAQQVWVKYCPEQLKLTEK